MLSFRMKMARGVYEIKMVKSYEILKVIRTDDRNSGISFS